MDNTLRHHGIPGQKHGVRRFQNRDGSLTPAGRLRYLKGETDRIDVDKYKQAKEIAIKSGSAKDVEKFKGDLTAKEMNDAINRIRWEDSMKQYSDKEAQVGKQKADNFFKSVDGANKKARTAIEAWNTIANVINSVSNREVPLPTISTNTSNDNKNQRIAALNRQQKNDRKNQQREESRKNKRSKRNDDFLDEMLMDIPFMKETAKEVLADLEINEHSKIVRDYFEKRKNQ